MTAFTYNDSPAVLADDPTFTSGPGVGALMPDTRLDDGFLSDKLGTGHTVLCFNASLAKKLSEAFASDTVLRTVTLPHPSAVCENFGASAQSVYLIRPEVVLDFRSVCSLVKVDLGFI